MLVEKQDLMEKYILPFIITVTTFFAPALYWVSLIGFFILVDFGLRSLIVIRDNPSNWVSSKAWRTVFKLGISLIFIISAFVSEKYIVPDVPVMKVIGSFLILVELKSIDEKAKEIFGFSLFSIVIDKITPKK